MGIKRSIHWIRGLFPSPLPRGGSEFDQYCQSIIDTYTIPDFPSFRRTIASLVMHLGPTTTHVPKMFFAKSIRKAMANEVAFQKIQQYKLEEQELQKKLAVKPEATSTEPLDVTAA